MRDYPLFDMPAQPVWHRGRVVLVGDSAHAVGPHAGQGAAMAIEDAIVLAACAGLERDFTCVFTRYESIRRPRVEKVAALTTHNRMQKSATTWLDRLLRRLILPLALATSIKAGRQLLSYRVDEQPLAVLRGSK